MELEIIIGVFILYLGFTLGYIWKDRVNKYDGVILIVKDEKKLTYSLVLMDDPETLEFKKKVLFKVDASEDNPDRE